MVNTILSEGTTFAVPTLPLPLLAAGSAVLMGGSPQPPASDFPAPVSSTSPHGHHSGPRSRYRGLGGSAGPVDFCAQHTSL